MVQSVKKSLRTSAAARMAGVLAGVFMVCGILAVVFAYLLKADDWKMGYGLEWPSVKG